MRALRLFLAIGALTVNVWAQAGDDADLREAHERFSLTASRALALFRSADSIAANLAARGAVLRADLTAGRKAIEQSLDRAEAALEKGDRPAVKRALDRAEGLLNRYAKGLGGS